eukprot:c13899_g1_i2.p2 GENE.c13899_g1_i2~~c13899_g1_i2.p2  ORF type:complete len:213 (-),score=48.85 c13899_g1_i2:70-708(-)
MWGRNNYGQCGVGHTTTLSTPQEVKGTFMDVALGYDFTVALDSEGQVFVFGDGLRGQLASEDAYTFSPLPKKIDFFDGVKVDRVAAGFFHAFAWSGDQLYGWGDNEYGQLGVGSGGTDKNTQPITTPVVVGTLPGTPTPIWKGKPIASVAGGRSHSAAITEGGDVYTWGSNDFGQLGLGDSVPLTNAPTLVKQLSNKGLAKVVCGYDTTFVT